LSARSLIIIALVGAGCGQRIVDGQFLGDATIRLNAALHNGVGSPRGLVGAVWLGYDLAQPLSGVETEVLPISQYGYPPTFTCDVLGAPPSAGQYFAPDGTLVLATLRLGRLIMFEDGDGNNAFSLDDNGQLAPPDSLIAVAAQQALVFVGAPPADVHALDQQHQLLDNWEAAQLGYQVVSLAGPFSAPNTPATVIGSRTQVIFSAASLSMSW
jgi:hypothetical protein